MEQNVFKTVAMNNDVSEEEVRSEIAEALLFADGLKYDGETSLDEIVALLAERVINAMEG